MKLAKSGSRGLFWRPDPRGAQEFTLPDGKRPAKGDARRGQRGAWWIRWTCPHGHLHRKPVGPKSAAQDESARHRLERPCPAREVKPVSHLLADVIRDYLAEVKSYKRSYRDDARYGKVWGERFAGRTLDEITAGEIEKIKTERLESVAPASVNREVGFLRHVFNVAIRDGKTERNPAARVRTLKEPSGRVRYLSDEEEDALLKALASDGDRQRVLMLVHTGLRKSEFLNLRWRDIDLRAGVLTIPRSKTA